MKRGRKSYSSLHSKFVHGTPTVDSLRKLINKAEKASDGHLTILKFTTNWKVGFGTPYNRTDIDNMATGKTLLEAMNNLMVKTYE